MELCQVRERFSTSEPPIRCGSKTVGYVYFADTSEKLYTCLYHGRMLDAIINGQDHECAHAWSHPSNFSARPHGLGRHTITASGK